MPTERPGAVAPGPWRLLAALVLALVGALASSCGSGGAAGEVARVHQGGGSRGYIGAWLDQPYRVPQVALSSTSGGRQRLADVPPGKVRVVFFGYSHCPDICQVVMSTIASAYARLGARQRRHVQVDFVTTDPARDTRQALRVYLGRFNPSFVGLTGPLRRILVLSHALHVDVEKGKKLPGGGYDVTHGTSVLGETADRHRGGLVRLIWTQDVSPAQLATDVTRLLKEQS